jgi:hypothetical protein
MAGISGALHPWIAWTPRFAVDAEARRDPVMGDSRRLADIRLIDFT